MSLVSSQGDLHMSNVQTPLELGLLTRFRESRQPIEHRFAPAIEKHPVASAQIPGQARVRHHRAGARTVIE